MARGGMYGSWGTAGTRCRMKRGKREGEAVVYFQVDNTVWVAVIWDNEVLPTNIRRAHMMFKPFGQRTFKAHGKRER
jgi:hypothetical protein